jgi:hypothetical protein
VVVTAVEQSSLLVSPTNLEKYSTLVKSRVVGHPNVEHLSSFDDCLIVESIKDLKKCFVPMSNVQPYFLGNVESTFPLNSSLVVNQVGLFDVYLKLDYHIKSYFYVQTTIPLSGARCFIYNYSKSFDVPYKQVTITQYFFFLRF